MPLPTQNPPTPKDNAGPNTLTPPILTGKIRNSIETRWAAADYDTRLSLYQGDYDAYEASVLRAIITQIGYKNMHIVVAACTELGINDPRLKLT